MGFAEHLIEFQSPEMGKKQKHAEQESEITDTVDYERLLSSVGRCIPLKPEPDEEIRT